MKVISAVVPCYNSAAYMEKAINSLLTGGDEMEIIIVDDGSSDGSREVLTEFAARDGRVKPVFKENGGVTSARLRGVLESSGDWVGFVDGDDEIEPDMYERLLANAGQYGADISHCGYQMAFADGRVHFFHNSGVIRQQSTETAIRDLLEGSLVEPGLCNKLYRRQLFWGLAEKMDFSIRINEDLLMNYYLFSAAEKTVFEDWCPYHYIVRGSSASRQKLNDHRVYDPIRVKQIILEDVPDELLPDARRAYVNTCVYSYCGLVTAGEYPSREAKGYLRGMLKNHRDWCRLLPNRTKLLAGMIVKTPWLFETVFRLRVRYMQKKTYD